MRRRCLDREASRLRKWFCSRARPWRRSHQKIPWDSFWPSEKREGGKTLWFEESRWRKWRAGFRGYRAMLGFVKRREWGRLCRSAPCHSFLKGKTNHFSLYVEGSQGPRRQKTLLDSHGWISISNLEKSSISNLCGLCARIGIIIRRKQFLDRICIGLLHSNR